MIETVITTTTTTAANPLAGAAPATIADAFRIAIDPDEGKARTATSTQNDEWARAGLEAMAVLGPDRLVRELSAHDGRLLAQSALLRMAADQTVEAWDGLLTPRRAALGPEKPRITLDDLVAAFHEARGPHAAPLTEPLQGRRWCELVVYNVRAQLKFVLAYAPERFAGAERFACVEELTVLLPTVARRIGATMRLSVNRTRPAIAEAQHVMRRLMDPRLRVYYLLSPSCNANGALRVQRSHIEFQMSRSRYRIKKTKRDGTVVPGFSYVEGASAAYLEAALASLYAPFETRWQAHGEDYAVFAGHAWNGTQLVPDAEGALLRMDPRLWLMLVLGIEGRLEQQHRLTYRMLQRVEDGSMCLRSPGIATKQASDLPLCAAQVDALAFACAFGHLAPLLRAYDVTAARRREKAKQKEAQQEKHEDAGTPAIVVAGAADDVDTAETTASTETSPPTPTGARLDVDDFPLCPAGVLVSGQSPVTTESLQPSNDRTLWDWNEPVLRALKIKEDGTGLRTWRRLFVDLYKLWEVEPAVHGLITGHGAIASVGTVTNAAPRGDTLTEVYFDSRAAHLLAGARDVMEHLRTTFVFDGTPYVRPR